jgi:hypothetical protein
MRPLSAPQLVEIWEQGSALPAVERALLLLEYACPEKTSEELAALNLGRRDTLLLALREQTFGPALDGYAECSACGAGLEFSLDTRTLGAPFKTSEANPVFQFSEGEIEIRFRLPNSLDLAVVANEPDVEQTSRALVSRCVLEATRGDAPIVASEHPEVRAALSAKIAECDPQAEIRARLECPACGAVSEQAFDIVSFFWSEISAHARRLLREVDILARAYGWREWEVLSLSPARRQFYLDLVGA